MQSAIRKLFPIAVIFIGICPLFTAFSVDFTLDGNLPNANLARAVSFMFFGCIFISGIVGVISARMSWISLIAMATFAVVSLIATKSFGSGEFYINEVVGQQLIAMAISLVFLMIADYLRSRSC